MKFYTYDCSEDDKTCPEDIKRQLPAVTGYSPAGINPYTNKPLVHTRDYAGAVSKSSLMEFLKKNIPYRGKFVTDDNMEEFLEEDLNKVILFSDK